jgi:hypothetical protein
VNISTNFVKVILEAKWNPAIMDLWNSLQPQTAAGEGEWHFGKEYRPWRQAGLWSNSSPATSGHVSYCLTVSSVR